MQRGNQPVSQLGVGMPGDPSVVFATSSCMGCHGSAPIAAASYIQKAGLRRQATTLWSGPQTADFLWMLSHRARWEQKQIKTQVPPIGSRK